MLSFQLCLLSRPVVVSVKVKLCCIGELTTVLHLTAGGNVTEYDLKAYVSSGVLPVDTDNLWNQQVHYVRVDKNVPEYL